MTRIFKLKMEGGIGIVTINVIGQTMNTWSESTLADYSVLMEDLKKYKTLKGIIFISGKPDNFFVGADLNMLAGLETPKAVLDIINQFHSVSTQLKNLNLPSVAAIYGHCLGGGLEFALGCTARIVKEGKSTRIGLPECNIGIFPGGGGTQRLIRLIGYPAIELILKGEMVDAKRAFELGIMDRLIAANLDLEAEAKSFMTEIINGKANLYRPVHDFSHVDDFVEQARKNVLKVTRGREIPGPMLALDAIKRGIKVSLEEGLDIEKANFVQVALSANAKGSFNTFFIKGLTDKPKTMMTKGFVPKPIKWGAVLGFGTMGRGIVIDILRHTSIPVLVKDIPEAIDPGKAFVRKTLEGMAEKGRLKEPVDAILARLKPVSEYIPDFQHVDIVIEAVFEDIKVKQQVFGDLSKVVRNDCIIASNTSFLSISKMAKHLTHSERFGGTHFFSPVWIMQLVEVIRGAETSQETVDNLLNFSDLIRKRPIVCKDNPGFVVNALLFPYVGFSYQCIEEGIPIETVDRAMVNFGMPIGPIRLTDEVGIDVLEKIFSGMGIQQETLNRVVADGRMGFKKSGKGFFQKDGSVDPAVLPLIGKRAAVSRTEEDIQRGALEAMVKAGITLLDRGIVTDVRLIDVGCIWGSGFPTDKGGPMKWADLTGLSKELFGKNFY